MWTARPISPEGEMKNFLITSIVLAAIVSIPGAAFADDVSDRSDAIRLCRAEVAAQVGQDVERVRLDQVRVRPRAVRVDLDIWRHGELQNVRCEVTRSRNDLSITSVTPTQQTASAPTAAAD
jgi:hypothetical protein